MAIVKRFEDLEVWQLIESTSLKNDYKLREQMNSFSGSIMDNIAEGFERDGNKEFIYFLSISKASCGELRSQLNRCLDRNHITSDTFETMCDKSALISKKTKSFMTYLQKSDRKGSKYD